MTETKLGQNYSTAIPIVEPPKYDQIAAALAKAQGEFKTVPLSGRNPRFGSKFATLADIITATRAALSANGIAQSQEVVTENGAVFVRTHLYHESGQSIESRMEAKPAQITSSSGKDVLSEMQALGVAISYARRYSLAALLGVAGDEDTDGEQGEQGQQGQAQSQTRRQTPQGRRAPKQPPAPSAKADQKASSPEPGEGTPDLSITSPKQLLAAINAEVPYYDSATHALRALRKIENDNTIEWASGAGREVFYAEAYAKLVDHARASAAGGE